MSRKEYAIFFIELEFHSSLGKLWEKIFKGIGLNKETSILDLCPGAFPKVELGLFYSDFRGQVSILDCSREALGEAEKFLGLFNPKFSVKSVVADAFRYNGPAHDMVVANHMLDDLLLGWATKEMKMELEDVYGSERCLLAAWENILKRRRHWKELTAKKVPKMLSGMASSGGYVILTQYPSYVERTLRLHKVSAFLAELLDGVSDALMASGFSPVNFRALRFIEENVAPFGAKHCRVLQRS